MKYVDRLSDEYKYDNNIKHVLYIIIPIFMINYGLKNERKILKLFEEVPIVISDVNNSKFNAFFARQIKTNGKDFYVSKKIVLNNYNGISLVNLIDSLIHEFNHAINSMNNELIIEQDYIYLRTGITYVKYQKNDLSNPAEKTNSLVLEEVLNTIQTEKLIRIMVSLNDYKIDNLEFNNMLYALNNEIKGPYFSNSYLLQTFATRALVENKTFINTLEQLRFNGNVFDVSSWFDNIVGSNGAYDKLCSLLVQIQIEEEKFTRSKMLKNWRLSKIKGYINEINYIVGVFNNNCLYK